LSRDPENRPLHAGIKHPGLVPTTTFDDVPLYRADRELAPEEIVLRRDRYWRPYHDRMAAALSEIKAKFGIAVLFDCHSIRPLVQRYSPDRLPDISIGTADGTSCAPGLRMAISETFAGNNRYSVAVDGIFKGGYITRHYGRPDAGQHSFQIELSQATYMRWGGNTPILDGDLAASLRPVLKLMIENVLRWIGQSQATKAGN
jgi:N-formylglutamate deformylase